MTFQGWFQIALYVAVLTALTPLLGGYMAKVYMGRRVALERVLGPVERGFYRAVRTDPNREQDWKLYGRAVLVFSALFWLIVRWVRPSKGVVLQLVQHRQPVGRLIVTFRQGQWIPPVIRLALATVAHALVSCA